MESTFPSLQERLAEKGQLYQLSKTFSTTNLSKKQSAFSQKSRSQLLEDISNPRIREIILSHKNIKGLLQQCTNIQKVKKHKQEVKDHQLFMKQFDQRKWLTKKGKKYLIDFDNEERREMKQYFNSLDQKKCGSIGIDQLEELLLSVGLFETREEIKILIDSVDQDKSGKIEFGQFLSMIQNDQGQNQEIVSFFKTVIGGKMKENKTQYIEQYRKKIAKRDKYSHQNSHTSCISQILQKYPYPKGLPFEMVVSHIRRKHMMTALNIGRQVKKIDPPQVSTQCLGSNGIGSNTVIVNGDHSIDQIAKGQRVMGALQKMYERKLIRQIKETKRASQPAMHSINQMEKEVMPNHFKSFTLKRNSSENWLNSAKKILT